MLAWSGTLVLAAEGCVSTLEVMLDLFINNCFGQQDTPEARLVEDLRLADIKGKIQNLLAQGTVDADSKLVLVNAVYFKGNWEKKFDEDNTEERPFIVTKNESKPVKMMCQKGTFNTAYIEEVATNVLELPYTQDELSMIILLPDEIGGLEK
eukprot:g33511.t1